MLKPELGECQLWHLSSTPCYHPDLLPTAPDVLHHQHAESTDDAVLWEVGLGDSETMALTTGMKVSEPPSL